MCTELMMLRLADLPILSFSLDELNALRSQPVSFYGTLHMEGEQLVLCITYLLLCTSFI